MGQGLSGAAVVAILAVVLLLTNPGIRDQAFAATGGAGLGTTGGATQLTSGACQTDGTNAARVVVKDSLLTGDNYIPATIVITDSDGNVITTTTAAGGTTQSPTEIAVGCSLKERSGEVFVSGGSGSTTNYATAAWSLAPTETNSQIVTITTSNTTALNLCIKDNALQNTSVSCGSGGTGTTPDSNETAATTMGTGSVRSGYYTVTGATAQRQFGSTDKGVLWALDYADTTVFDTNDISLSSTQIALSDLGADCFIDGKTSRAKSQDGAERCYTSGAIQTGYGEIGR